MQFTFVPYIVGRNRRTDRHKSGWHTHKHTQTAGNIHPIHHWWTDIQSVPLYFSTMFVYVYLSASLHLDGTCSYSNSFICLSVSLSRDTVSNYISGYGLCVFLFLSMDCMSVYISVCELYVCLSLYLWTVYLFVLHDGLCACLQAWQWERDLKSYTSSIN